MCPFSINSLNLCCEVEILPRSRLRSVKMERIVSRSLVESTKKRRREQIRSALQSHGNTFHGKLSSCVRARDISHASADRPQDIRFLTRAVRGAVDDEENDGGKKARRTDRERLAIPNPVLSFPHVDRVART